VKVFLDTNILVSAVATRGLCADLFQAILADHDLVVGETVLTELRGILQNKLQAPTETFEEMELFLRREAVVVEDAPALDIVIRDVADAVVLAEAVAAEVDVLVTGDRDLLEIATTAPVRILNPRGSWEELRSDDASDE
jgi:putative PIN family toxin of toxin-antitoxin system